MKPEEQKENKATRKKRKRSKLFLLPILLILIVGILFFIATQQQDINGSFQQSGSQFNIWKRITETFSGGSKQTPKEKTGDMTGKAASQKESVAGEKNKEASTLSANTHNSGLATENKVMPQSTVASSTSQKVAQSPISTDNSFPAILSGNSNSCKQAVDKINAFYAHLDRQPYMQAFHLDKKSRIYFSELIQKLLDNPPVITRETDDLFTVLKNTAHFYRVIGKKNITILKTILENEKPYIEKTLADFYKLTEFPGCLQKSFSIRVPPYAIYDYAGFFLNTMGGRLYLFRRDSVSRMTVSYYGILVIDKSNNESDNRDGIQVKKAIDSLISEMENSGKQLKLKDKYLDKLYDLKEKYQ